MHVAMVYVINALLKRLIFNYNITSMKQRIEDANKYYHGQYPEDAIFYKLPQGYMVFGVEAVRLGSLLGVQLHTVYELPSILISASSFLDKTEILNMCGISYRAISYLEDDGILAIPDVKRIMEDKEFDY